MHVLVALAFIGPRPKGAEVCHGDGDKTNNRPENLRYGTRAENAADMVAHGGSARGERHAMARLRAEDVEAIRRELATGGRTHRAIAESYGVSRPTVTAINNRRLWRHMGDAR